MAAPPKANLIAYQGDTWAQTFRFLDGGEPVDLTGATAAAAARATTGVVFDLQATVGPEPGEVTIALPEFGLLADVYDYDVEIDQDGAVRTWIRGKLAVRRDVTNEVFAA